MHYDGSHLDDVTMMVRWRHDEVIISLEAADWENLSLKVIKAKIVNTILYEAFQLFLLFASDFPNLAQFCTDNWVPSNAEIDGLKGQSGRYAGVCGKEIQTFSVAKCQTYMYGSLQGPSTFIPFCRNFRPLSSRVWKLAWKLNIQFQ